MPAPPRHQLGHVVVGDLGDKLVLAEEVNQQAKQRPRVRRPGKVLRVFLPVTPRDIVKPQRRARGFGLRNELLGALTFGPLYGLGFPPGRLLRRSEKATTSDLEIVLPERGARVASAGHGASF